MSQRPSTVNILPHRHWEAIQATVAVACFVSIGVLLAL